MFKRILVVLLVLGTLLPLTSSAQSADEIARLIAELQRQIGREQLVLLLGLLIMVRLWPRRFRSSS
ncbi:MAG: hypothetical protein HYT46_03140 [Candidatus Vogelbacteria bacterium]|nr:hypothetical protein [Candidatus Vogelbacteria bacterium]